MISELKARNGAEVARLFQEYEAFLFCGDVDSAYRVLEKIADLKSSNDPGENRKSDSPEIKRKGGEIND